MMLPVEIRRSAGGHGMKIRWQDGMETAYTARELRERCQCAACRHEFTGERLLDPATLPADLTLQKIDVVGTYALGLRFSDGHASGIYPFSTLRAAGATSEN